MLSGCMHGCDPSHRKGHWQVRAVATSASWRRYGLLGFSAAFSFSAKAPIRACCSFVKAM